MLSLLKNGKEIRIEAIYDKGNVGQMVILGEVDSWDLILNPIRYPLSQYPCPSIFTIVEKHNGKDGYYILRDNEGNYIKLQDEYYGAYENYLYDAQEWLTWNNMLDEEDFSNTQKEIEQLECQLELLKDILIKQGIRIVTETQAKQLGIN